MMAREHKLSIKFYLFSCAMNCSLLFANLTSNFLIIEAYQSSYQYYNTQHDELVLNHRLSRTSITLTSSIKKVQNFLVFYMHGCNAHSCVSSICGL
jgi:hypothetical protein